MRDLNEREIMEWLIGVISDGFNRSLGALEAAGALDTSRMRPRYTGVGSLYYDLVTEQVVLTANYGAAALWKLLHDGGAAADEVSGHDPA